MIDSNYFLRLIDWIRFLTDIWLTFTMIKWFLIAIFLISNRTLIWILWILKIVASFGFFLNNYVRQKCKLRGKDGFQKWISAQSRTGILAIVSMIRFPRHLWLIWWLYILICNCYIINIYYMLYNCWEFRKMWRNCTYS